MNDPERHWRDSRWTAYQNLDAERLAELERATKEALKRRGLPKQSWALLANVIGENLAASSEVINATLNGRRLDEVADALVTDLANEFNILFTNTSQASAKKSGASILSATLKGRIKYFVMNMKKGVFDELEQIHRAYPNLVKVNR
jgi:hypothetical protein